MERDSPDADEIEERERPAVVVLESPRGVGVEGWMRVEREERAVGQDQQEATGEKKDGGAQRVFWCFVGRGRNEGSGKGG